MVGKNKNKPLKIFFFLSSIAIILLLSLYYFYIFQHFLSTVKNDDKNSSSKFKRLGQDIRELGVEEKEDKIDRDAARGDDKEDEDGRIIKDDKHTSGLNGPGLDSNSKGDSSKMVYKDSEPYGESAHKRGKPPLFASHRHSLIPKDLLALLNDPRSMPDLRTPPVPLGDGTGLNEGDGTGLGGGGGPGNARVGAVAVCDPVALKREASDAGINVAFAQTFAEIFADDFSGLPWWLDEGGLIGAARQGSLSSADDDFDFFALLPNQTAPCSPLSLTCTPEEFNPFIHRFLMVFWRRGLCINKFHTDLGKFKSNNRLMYSLQLYRNDDLPPDKCFERDKKFAHMHLGILTLSKGKGVKQDGKTTESFGDGSPQDSAKEEPVEEVVLRTNIWAKGSNHVVDNLSLKTVLPLQKCKCGTAICPCPLDVINYLSTRNKGEYISGKKDGKCLLIRNSWSRIKRVSAVKTVRNLHACGYNSLVNLTDKLEKSDFKSC